MTGAFLGQRAGAGRGPGAGGKPEKWDGDAATCRRRHAAAVTIDDQQAEERELDGGQEPGRGEQRRYEAGHSDRPGRRPGPRGRST